MNNKITKQDVVARLEENGMPFAEFALQDGLSVVISQYGGRIFGPFVPDGESMAWINAAFAGAESFTSWRESGDWNLGGDRIWIAPEQRFNVRDRYDFWNSYDLPTQVDPGTYQLDQPQAGQYRLAQAMELAVYDRPPEVKLLQLEKVIRQVENPLRKLGNAQALMDGVLFAGYEQQISLSDSRQDSVMTEAWSVIQLNPGGVLLIPAVGCVEHTDYYEPIDEKMQTIYPNHIRLRITGDRRYKVGYKAAQVFGRLGYFNHFDDGRAYLIVRNFFNNPSTEYVEEPAESPGIQGSSIHVYNDGGMFGGFGELECNCQTIGGLTGRSSSTDQLVLWVYLGEVERIKEIALNLVGVEL